MLRTIAASTALAALLAFTPAPEARAGIDNPAYRQCMANANWYCLPLDSDGFPYIPGTSEEEAAYQLCYEAAAAYCATLLDPS